MDLMYSLTPLWVLLPLTFTSTGAAVALCIRDARRHREIVAAHRVTEATTHRV